MAKSDKQFEKVLKVLTDADGGAVTKEYLLKELEGEIVANRISTYLWEIRSKANITVESIRDGRKVVGYRIPVQAAPAPDGSAPEIPEGATPVASEADAIATNRVYYDASQVDESNE